MKSGIKTPLPLSGDTMLVQSYDLLMSVEDTYLKVLNTFNKALKKYVKDNSGIWISRIEDVSILEYLK